MPQFDLPLTQLATYRSGETAPADFDTFWSATLAEAARHPLDARFTPQTDPLYQAIAVDDVTFRGWGGQPVKGWFLRPSGATGRLPCLVTFIGYGGGRGLPLEHVAPVAAGFAHFVMDTRGQGSVWGPGDTPDDAGSGPQTPGFMTRGIDSRDTYYYRRVFTDAVRAVEAAASHPAVDPTRLGVMGGSQGGGISIAAAGLLRDRIKVLMPDVPFLCHFRRAVPMLDTAPYNEIATYCKAHRGTSDRVFRVLDYFDGQFFAERTTARSLFSVGLMDNICPPSTVYAAYNRIPSPKDIRVWDYNNHEGGGPYQLIERLRFAQHHL